MGRGIRKSDLAVELGVSRSSLYYKSKIPEKDELLRVEIELIMQDNPGYGHRRVALALERNRKVVLRVMKKFKLKPARRCKTPVKSGDLNKAASGYADITKVISAIVPDCLWTGDFTYISYRGKFIYLAVVQDRWSAEILGLKILTSHNRELVIEAFKDALLKYGTRPEYFHSDQGSEYDSIEFKELLMLEGINISNSPKGSPWRNGAQESFFGRFKVEFGEFDRFGSLEELMIEIYQYIFYYNRRRIHTRLKSPPWEFRERYFAKKQEFAKNPIISKLTPPPTRSY